MKTIISLFTFGFILSLNAQQGVSSGSLSMSRSNGYESRNANGFLPEKSIIVEDFMNYHKHQIKIPQHVKTAISIDYHNTILENKNQFLLQVGLATQETYNLEDKKTVNVSLVIDRSGSMSSQNKLEKVKNALLTFVDGLNEGDFISIVTFDSNAQTILNAQKINQNKQLIKNVINNIYTGGSTNINHGLQLGYAETIKNHNVSTNSKVILLTDGMTNSGETNIENIIKNSLVFNDKGIDISTIGVGNSLDFDLLKKLAVAGRGSNHFIGDNEEDIQKVFVDELQSLVYQIGEKPEITIEIPKNCKLVTTFGYSPQIENNKVKFKIENLGFGITQIFLLKLERITLENSTIKATLNYETENGLVSETETKKYNPNKDFTQLELEKNYAITLMAENLNKASKEYAQNNFAAAKSIVQQTIQYVNKYVNQNDQDIDRVYSILKKYDPNTFHYAMVSTP